jgi:hypothetical protein
VTITTHERLNSLRLAARTLIEWKAPPSTEEYQTILADLLKVHPFAAECGLTSGSDVLKLDTQGVILWFLTDTLNTKTTHATGAEVMLDTIRRVELSLGIGKGYFLELEEIILLYFKKNLLSSDQTKFWPGGPSKATVSNVIIEQLIYGSSSLTTADAVTKIKAINAFLALQIPLDIDTQNETIRDLLSARRGQRLVKLMLLLSNSTNIFSTFQVIVGLAVLLLIPNLSGNTHWVLIVTALVSMIVPFIKKYRQGIYEIARNMLLRSASIAKPVRNVKGIRKMIVEELWLNYCTIPGYAVSFLKNAEESCWVGIVLGKNATVTDKIKFIHTSFNPSMIKEEVVRELLQLLANPDFNIRRRVQLFQWLCRVKIRTQF